MARSTNRENRFLLIMSYPAFSWPVGLFESFAADRPPPDADRLDGSDDELADRWMNTDATVVTHGVATNGQPNGYAIQEFDTNGHPIRWAKIEPYNDREPTLPGEGAAAKIDPDQELNWN